MKIVSLLDWTITELKFLSKDTSDSWTNCFSGSEMLFFAWWWLISTIKITEY